MNSEYQTPPSRPSYINFIDSVEYAYVISTFDFSTLYSKFHHNPIKEKLTELIEQTYNREGSFHWLGMRNVHFSLLNNLKDLNCGHVRKFVTLSIFLRTIYLKELAQTCIYKL